MNILLLYVCHENLFAMPFALYYMLCYRWWAKVLEPDARKFKNQINV